MRIGITYDLKSDVPAPLLLRAGGAKETLPDDWQEEYDSPKTIDAIAAVLREMGHQVERLGDGPDLLRKLLDDPPEFIFNIAEGQGIGRSREARVPAVLEMLGIPYSGSDPLTLAATLDKDVAKRLVASTGVATPKSVFIADCHEIRQSAIGNRQFPVIVKPAWEGSSKGIRNKCLVDRAEDLEAVVASLQQDHRQPVLIEEYIAGEELTVGLVGNPPEIIGILRVIPNQASEHFIYSLEIKRDFERLVRYESPPRLPPETLKRVERAAHLCFQALGCRDVSRIDFRLSADGTPYFLEANPLPGLNPESSDLVILSKLCGWSYHRLIASILQAALERR